VSQRWFEDFTVGASSLAPIIVESIVAFVEQATRFKGPAFIGDTIKPEHEIVALERKRSAGLLAYRGQALTS